MSAPRWEEQGGKKYRSAPDGCSVPLGLRGQELLGTALRMCVTLECAFPLLGLSFSICKVGNLEQELPPPSTHPAI